MHIYKYSVYISQVPHAAPKVSESRIAEERAMAMQKKNQSYQLLMSDDEDDLPATFNSSAKLSSSSKEDKRQKHLR